MHLFTVASLALHFLSSTRASTLLEEDSCRVERQKAERRREVVEANRLRPYGHWVSEGCEIYPGPKFLLRAYQFRETGGFLLHQFHYSDEACSTPSFAIVAEGRLYPQGRDLSVPSGHRFDYALKSVDLVPYDPGAMRKYAEILVNSTCFRRSQRFFDFKPYAAQRVFRQSNVQADWYSWAHPSRNKNEMTDFDCLWQLNISFLELQLMQMRIDAKGHHHVLHTGNVKVSDNGLTYMRPSSFLQPLVNAYEVANCKTCKRISSSHAQAPPRLKTHIPTPIDNWSPSRFTQSLDGHWFSRECESEPNGYYVLRHVWISAGHRMWKMWKTFFDDANCRDPQFSLIAQGTFILGPKLAMPSSAFYVLHEVKRVRVRARSPRYARICRGQNEESAPHCALLKKYRTLVPSVIRVTENNGGHGLLLYTGDPADDSRKFPTSFLPPLVQCIDTVVFVSIGTNHTEVDNLQSTRYAMGFASGAKSWTLGGAILFSLLLPNLVQSGFL